MVWMALRHIRVMGRYTLPPARGNRQGGLLRARKCAGQAKLNTSGLKRGNGHGLDGTATYPSHRPCSTALSGSGALRVGLARQLGNGSEENSGLTRRRSGKDWQKESSMTRKKTLRPGKDTEYNSDWAPASIRHAQQQDPSRLQACNSVRAGMRAGNVWSG
jgi:hypothetical protein